MSAIEAPVPVLYRRWLVIGAWYGIFAGLSLVVSALLPAQYGATQLLRTVFWLSAEGPGALTPAARLATGVSGALTAGWGVMAYCLRPEEGAPAAADRRAGRALATALVTWFLVDGAASVLTGGALNVIGNVTFLIALLPPSVAMARR